MSSQNTNLKSNIVDIPLPKVAFNTHTMIELYEKCKESYNKLLDKKKNGVDESIQERADKKREDYVKAGVPEKDIEKYIKAFLKEETTNAKKLERLGGITISDDEMIKVYDKVIKYVKSYYYEITGGNYYFYNHDTETFDFKDDKYFKKEIDVKLELTLQILFSRNPDIYNIVSKIDKPRVYKMDGRFFINECRGMLHKNPKPFKKFSKETKENLNTMLEYIKEITCNNDSIFYEAYLKYLSQVCKGEKPQVIIYKKSEEGTGKSTESDFLINYVLGTGVCLVSGSTEPLTSNFNKILMGKLYVVFEELPTFSTAQWSAVSGKLKTLATEKTTVYRDCFEKAIQADNISNFVINTNVEAIKNTEGRRIIIAPINNSRIGDYAFFNNVRTQCFNLEVGECFYSYMLEKDTSEFFAENKEKGFPETEYKRIAIASLLSPTEKFLKFNYLL